ncbi:kinase domain-containing protein [Lipomyces japonicus]|uniref:kinase domain-containing protein n=1 Tax=Lipomyces japonicus TaxID=56871 RepID=UPI0034CE590E
MQLFKPDLSRQSSSRDSNHSNNSNNNSNNNNSLASSNIVTTSTTRFAFTNDGKSHVHQLKSARRQERLANMLRDMVGARKRNNDVNNDDYSESSHALSLMSSWLLQREHAVAAGNKKEKDKDGSGGKDPTGAPVSLVEKYGKCHEIIGKGAFGVVRISHKVDKSGMREQLYAVKEFRRRPTESAKRYTKRLTSEFCISSSLRHQNVIHTLDLIQDDRGEYCEVMEFCAGGDLYSLILSATRLEAQEADCYFKQLMRGVVYMHEMGVAHRDLKPENLLLTQRGALKITDFGNGECFRMAWERDVHLTNGVCGSAPYIAPEEYTEEEFDPRPVDIWATGVIYMAMRTGRHLWKIAKRDEDEYYVKYLEGRKHEAGYEPIEQLERARCRNVVYSILDPHPARRITGKQVLNSEWGREIVVCEAGEVGH